MSERTPNLGLFKYNVVEDGKQPFSIEKALNENWDILDKCGGGLEIGDIGVALYVDETQGKRRRLNGSILAINENTQGFVTFLKGLQATSPSLFVTETKWQAEVNLSKFGQCGKFVLNETAGTIRLPKVVNINGLQDLNQAGVRLDEKLPNITGTETSHLGGTENKSTGAIYIGDASTSSIWGASSGNRIFHSYKFDASRSSSTYQDNAPVQQEAIQYPYFIQIASSTQTDIDIHREVQLNNPFSLFDCKYTDHKLENVSWLLSQGQWNSASVYVSAYDLLAEILSGTKSVEGLSVKSSTTTYNDYDFVVNTSNRTFRLPLKTNLASGKAVVGNGMTLGLTDGTNFSGLYSSTQGATGLLDDGNSYGKTIGNTSPSGRLFIGCSIGVSQDSTKSGIETDTNGLYLYYYIGETVQNANLIDAGRIAETIATDIRIIQTYVNGTSGYRIWSDGYCVQWGRRTAGGSQTVTFLKKFRDTNYNVMINPYSSDTITTLITWVSSQTVSSFTVQNGYGATYNSYQYQANWKACGYLAQGQY